MEKLPDFYWEKQYWEKGYDIIGVDEVGRGCLAGPIYAAAICFRPQSEKEIAHILSLGINDSKLLSPRKREMLAGDIKKLAFCWSISRIKSKSVDRLGIATCNNNALSRAATGIVRMHPDLSYFLLSDAFAVRRCIIPRGRQLPLIHGDRISISIAAASIIAKVARDNYMKRLASKYPRYLWEENKGYGTAQHIEAIKKYGPTLHHRHGFLKSIK